MTEQKRQKGKTGIAISPDAINTKRHFWGAFGNCECENSARVIVMFCQRRGSWNEFTKKEIDAFSREDFWFNGLLDRELITEADGQYHVTPEFVGKCYAASPRR